MIKKSYPLSKVFSLLESGPVVLVSTSKKEKQNVMPMSWHMMMDFEPPLIGCIISNRNYTFEILKSTKECVIGIPTVGIAEKVVRCGNTSGRKIDKFSKFGLTPLEASTVKAPLIKECFANFECKVVDLKMANKYNMFVLEVLKAWVDPAKKNHKTIHHYGYDRFMVAGKTIKVPSKMR